MNTRSQDMEHLRDRITCRHFLSPLCRVFVPLLQETASRTRGAKKGKVVAAAAESRAAKRKRRKERLISLHSPINQ